MFQVYLKRRNSYLACQSLAKWFVLVYVSLVFILNVRGCTEVLQIIHTTGDVRFNCSVSDNEITPVCKDKTSKQFTECKPSSRHCVSFDNTTNTVIFTIDNTTDDDFMTYECGENPRDYGAINWICCFNLTKPLLDSTLAYLPTFSTTVSLPTSGLTEQVTTEKTATSESTSPAKHCNNTITSDMNTFTDICMQSSVRRKICECLPSNCPSYPGGNSSVTFKVLLKNNTAKYCNVTCASSSYCQVISSEGESTTKPTPNSTDPGIPNNMVKTVLYILCGVMILLMVLIAGLCLYLWSERETVQKQEDSIYSHTLGNVKLTRVEFQAKNSSTSNSNQGECERAENQNELGYTDQNLSSGTSGWEDNIAYESYTTATEGDYADVDEKHSFSGIDEVTSNDTIKGSPNVEAKQNPNLYECVINKESEG